MFICLYVNNLGLFVEIIYRFFLNFSFENLAYGATQSLVSYRNLRSVFVLKNEDSKETVQRISSRDHVCKLEEDNFCFSE
jgi:hypothetical protein